MDTSGDAAASSSKAKSFVDPNTIPGGFSDSPLAKMPHAQRLAEAMKINKADEGTWRAAANLSHAMAKIEAKKPGHGAFAAGYEHEAIETVRLRQAQRHELVASQEPVDFGSHRRIPDLQVSPVTDPPDFPVFIDVKAGRNMRDSVNQLRDLQTRGQVNVAAGVSSAHLDMGSLDRADGGGLRVRSSSMSEGQFISVNDMHRRRELRGRQFQEVRQGGPEPFPVV